jgi:uncharacterized membrane protein YqiK
MEEGSAIMNFLSHLSGGILTVPLIILAVLVILYVVFKLLGFVRIGTDSIGIVEKWWSPKGSVAADGLIALKGEAGFQAKTLAPGLYFGKWIWQYDVTMEFFTVIPEGKIGLVLAKDGAEIPTGNILAQRVDCDNFQDAERFLNSGGQRGRQTATLQQVPTVSIRCFFRFPRPIWFEFRKVWLVLLPPWTVYLLNPVRLQASM